MKAVYGIKPRDGSAIRHVARTAQLLGSLERYRIRRGSDAVIAVETRASMDESPPKQAIEEVVTRAQAGEQAAFGCLYEMYYDQIYRYVSFKCGSVVEAEDLTGEVFLKMLESIDKFEFRGFPFTSWL